MKRVVLGVDQGRSSGWGISAEGLGRIVAHGLVIGGATIRAAAARADVVKRALEFAGGDPKLLFAMLEQHDHMPVDRLTVHDRQTQRRDGNRQAAPERSLKSFMGQGKSYGRWEEQLLLVGVPPTHLLEVIPPTWRKATHGVTRGDEDTLKNAALAWANRHLGAQLTDHNEAEGVCITAFGALYGISRYDAELQAARMKARVERETAKQTDLFGKGGT